MNEYKICGTHIQCNTTQPIDIAWRNINNLRYTADTTPMAKSEEELKPLDEGKRGE